MSQFQEQIDFYENLHDNLKGTEYSKWIWGFLKVCLHLFFQGMENLKIIQSWFKVDIKPYKMSLLNNIKRWSFAFKKHLMDHVVTSLGELNSFIERADEGLMTQVKENDYNGLIAGILLKIFQFYYIFIAFS